MKEKLTIHTASRFWIRMEKLLGHKLSGHEVNNWRRKLGLDVMAGCPEAPNETIETAGCTGGCEYYDAYGLPDCGRCSQMEAKVRSD